MRGAAAVTSYFTHCFPFDPEARHVWHFDSKLDTGDQSSSVMTHLPSATATSPLATAGGGVKTRGSLANLFICSSGPPFTFPATDRQKRDVWDGTRAKQ